MLAAFAADVPLSTSASDHLLLIAMHGLGRESRHAYRYIFGALRTRSAVTNPLARTGPDCLPYRYLMHSITCLDLESSAEDNRKLIKRRSLCWLGPTRRTDHSSDTYRGSGGVHAT